jgi:nucleoside-diphosphate-sugar epimerase
MPTPTGESAPPLQGRRVVLLGGLGFLGLNLVPELLGAGARVEIVSRSADPLALSWLARQAGGSPVGVHLGDIRDAEKLPGWLQDADLVINLAGESGAVRSARDALTDAEVNVGGHLAVLEALRGAPRPARVVFISSRLVYGVTGPAPVDEAHPARPTSLYGLHKLTVEHYHRLYREHFGIPSTVLRLTNPYGPFQLPDRREHGILNRFILAALRGETITLFGGGRQLRDFLHVSDVTAAILRAATAGEAVGETLNVGAGVSVSLGEVARRIVGIAGSGEVAPAAWPAGYERVETGDFLCDTGRIAGLLGWQPGIDLETGLRRTVAAYREILAGAGCPAARGGAR